MSSEKLELHEENLRTILEETRILCGNGLVCQPKDRATISALEQNLTKGETLLRDLQFETLKAPHLYQEEVSQRIIGYKAEITSLRRRMEGKSLVGAREEPFQPVVHNDLFDMPHRDEERIQLLRNTETLKRASASVHRAQQVSAQTDQVGVEIIDELDEQKSTLIRTRRRLTDIDHETDRSKILLSTIACKAVQNRLILIAVIILELLVLAGVLFYKLYKKFH